MHATERKDFEVASRVLTTRLEAGVKSRTRPAVVSLIVAVTVALSLRAFAADAPRTTLDGVFTAAQVERGRTVFASSCVRCHMADLSGNNGPSLKGERFLDSWENDTVDGLFTKIRDSMPPRVGNAVLTDDAKIDVVAYLLSVNGFPSGAEELRIDTAALENIEIIRAEKQGTVRNFALVQVVGCVGAGTGAPWRLTSASDPVVVGNPVLTTEEVQAARARSLGSGTFTLVSVDRFNPGSHEGQKVAARGLVYRGPNRNLLTVTSLQTVEPRCGD